MGWWTDTKKFGKKTAGKLARTSAVAGAGVLGSLTPCGPVCGVAAAAAVDTLLGDKIERTASRAIDKGGAKANDFVDYLKGGGKPVPRPAGLATTVEGMAAPTRLTGKAEMEGADGAPLLLAGGAGALGVLAVTLLVLRKTGRI